MFSKGELADIDEACAVLEEGEVSLLELLSIDQKLRSGQLRAVLTRSAEGTAALVVEDHGLWRQVLVGRGPERAVLAGLTALRGQSEALIWEEGAVQVEGAGLDALGFRLLERQTFTQALSRVPLEHPEPADLEVIEVIEVLALTKADHAAARRVFAQTHAMNIEGLYTTWPTRPTLEECGLAFDQYLSGALGKVVPSACVVTRSEGRVVGVICCGATQDADTAVLLGLGVDPSVRGRGLSRILVRRAQRALKAAGFAKMLFWTTDRNAPVQRLFTPEEIVSTESSPTRLWLREA